MPLSKAPIRVFASASLGAAVALAAMADSGHPTAPPGRTEIASPVEIPMHRIHGLPAVDVTINGSAPYRFVVDWGANILAVSPRVAAELALPKTGRDEMGNENVRIGSLALHGAKFRGLTAAVDPFFSDKEEQGVLGLNVFAELLVTLDYPRSVVRLEKGALPAADGRSILAIGTGEGEPGPTIDISIGGLKVRALLDTGAARWLALPQKMLPDLPLKAGPVTVGTATGPQVGTFRQQEARIKGDLRFGAFTVRDPIVSFHPRPRALLGSALLEHFVLTLDQKGAKVRFGRDSFEPISAPEAPWERPSSVHARSPGPAGPAPALPDTPEGRRLAAFFAAADAGTEAAVRAFIEKNFPPEALKELPLEDRLRNIHGFIKNQAPFEIVRLMPPLPDATGVLARSKKTGSLLQISLELEEGPRRGVLGLRVEEDSGEGPEKPAAEPKANDADLAAAVDAEVTQLASKDAFSGVVLLARGGKPFFQKAWGMADRGLSVPNSVDTKFNIGSIGKAFTRAAVMDLVKSKRLALSDTVAKHLPGIRIPSADTITVQQLLDMKSGLGDIFGKRYRDTPKEKLRELSDFLPLFENVPLRFAPGQGREYSNAGYVVLGLIIEKVSGKPYWDFVRERVFVPAGMTSTGPFGPDEIVTNRAIGYTKSEGGQWRSNVYALPERASSAGGVHSTAADLLAFSATLGGLGIAGGTEGANAVLEAPGKGGLTIIVLANLDPPAAESLTRRIRSWAPPADKAPSEGRHGGGPGAARPAKLKS